MKYEEILNRKICDNLDNIEVLKISIRYYDNMLNTSKMNLKSFKIIEIKKAKAIKKIDEINIYNKAFEISLKMYQSLNNYSIDK